MRRAATDHLCPPPSAPKQIDQNRVEFEAEAVDRELTVQSELLEMVEKRLWPVLVAVSPTALLDRAGDGDELISPVSRRMRGFASRLLDANQRLSSILSRLDV